MYAKPMQQKQEEKGKKQKQKFGEDTFEHGERRRPNAL